MSGKEMSEKFEALGELYDELAQKTVEISESILEVSSNLIHTEEVYFLITYLVFFSALISGLIFLYSLFLGSLSSLFTIIFTFSLSGFIVLFWFGRAFRGVYEVMNRAWLLFYKTIFETKDPVGQTPEERILNQLKLAFPSISNYIKKNPRFVRKNFKTPTGYVFDLYLHENRSILHKLTERIGEPGYDIFVKRFEDIVSVEDLKKVHRELLNYYHRLRWFKNVFDRVIVVSTSGFTEDALGYVKQGKSWIPEVAINGKLAPKFEDYLEEVDKLGLDYVCSIDLIKELKKGYRLVWAL